MQSRLNAVSYPEYVLVTFAWMRLVLHSMEILAAFELCGVFALLLVLFKRMILYHTSCTEHQQEPSYGALKGVGFRMSPCYKGKQADV